MKIMKLSCRQRLSKYTFVCTCLVGLLGCASGTTMTVKELSMDSPSGRNQLVAIIGDSDIATVAAFDKTSTGRVALLGDSLVVFSERESVDATESYSLNDLKWLRFEDQNASSGARTGAVVGGAIGAFIPFVTVASINSECRDGEFYFCEADIGFLENAAYVAAGGLLGAALGSILGSTSGPEILLVNIQPNKSFARVGKIGITWRISP